MFRVFSCLRMRARTHTHTHTHIHLGIYKLGGFSAIFEFSVNIFFQHFKRYFNVSNSCYNAQILFDFKTIFTL